MTQPRPTTDNPMPSRPGPCAVRLKECCREVAVGEPCKCVSRAEMRRAFANPITFRFPMSGGAS